MRAGIVLLLVVLTKSTSTRKINYLYNATGQKVAKKITNNSTETMTDYLNGFHYENEKLKFFATAEGYVNTNISSGNQTRQAFSYVYNYTDHLGNIRLSYTKGTGENPPVILEENHYYPFGLKHKKYGSVDKDLVCVDEDCYEVGIDVVPPQSRKPYQYKYQGQEWQDELGLNIYFYKYRMSDPALGRFLQIDPLSEGFVYNSPYAFAENKVVANFELEGLEAKLAIYGEGATGTSYTQSDINSFHARAHTLGKKGYSTHRVTNGNELLGALKSATAQEGSIEKAIIFAHGGYRGVFLNQDDGFYSTSNYRNAGNSTSVVDLVASLNSGEIKFENNGVIVFGSCNACNNSDITSIATQITNDTGITTIGATGYVSPEIANGKETGRLITDGTFIKTEQVYQVNFKDSNGNVLQTSTAKSMKEAEGMKLNIGQKVIHTREINLGIQSTDLGNTINPNDF